MTSKSQTHVHLPSFGHCMKAPQMKALSCQNWQQLDLSSIAASQCPRNYKKLTNFINISNQVLKFLADWPGDYAHIPKMMEHLGIGILLHFQVEQISGSK